MAPVTRDNPFGLDTPRPFNLTASRFAAGDQLANRRSSAARFVVPARNMLSLVTGQPLRLRLKAHAEITQTDAGASVVLDLAAAGLRIVASPAGAAASLPSTDHPDVLVYAAGVPVAVEAIDYDANTVTVTNPDAGNAVTYDVYGTAQEGQVQLVAVAPAALDNRGEIVLYDSTLRALHEIDQSNGRTAPKIIRPGRSALGLGPKWAVSIVVDSPASFVWNDEAKHDVLIPARAAGFSGSAAAVNRAVQRAL